GGDRPHRLWTTGRSQFAIAHTERDGQSVRTGKRIRDGRPGPDPRSRRDDPASGDRRGDDGWIQRTAHAGRAGRLETTPVRWLDRRADQPECAGRRHYPALD